MTPPRSVLFLLEVSDCKGRDVQESRGISGLILTMSWARQGSPYITVEETQAPRKARTSPELAHSW